MNNSVTQPGNQYGGMNTDKYSCVSLITPGAPLACSMLSFTTVGGRPGLLMCTSVKYTVMVLNYSICLVCRKQTGVLVLRPAVLEI